LGTWNPPSPPTPFPNNQLLDDPNGRLLDQILRARYPDNEQLPDAFPLEADAVASLLEDVGPSILFTHSGSGRPGWLTVFKTPKVAAVVDFEASVYAFPTGELPPGSTGQLEVPLADFLKLTKIPILVIFGDNLNGAWPPRLANAKAFVDKVNEHGGNAKLIHLPEIGIVGNSHIMMLEKNNAQIADVVSDWFKDNGLDKH
jgi:pimeloyl-ACP methyl ester carboxylesterase